MTKTQISVRVSPDTMAAIDAAAQQQYIESVDDERDTGDGYWVYLRPGYVFDSSTTFIHESTVADVKKALSRIGKVQP